MFGDGAFVARNPQGDDGGFELRRRQPDADDRKDEEEREGEAMNLYHHQGDDEDEDEHRPLIIPISSGSKSSYHNKTAGTGPAALPSIAVTSPEESTPHSSLPSTPKNLFRSRRVTTKRRGGRRQRQRGHINSGHKSPDSTGGGKALSANSSVDGEAVVEDADDGDADCWCGCGGGTGHASAASLGSPSSASKRQRRLCSCCSLGSGACSAKNRCMSCVARVLVWLTMAGLSAATFWYSYELFVNGIDPHLIAWFSAGAFVLLGFPISMYGIIMHLANYNQPQIQVYVVRILWMVPIYSVESWLAMRFHKQAIYIETLRDLYESYVLYSFLQFLIQVLGGEQALILMLKDKSPTRGVHMWGFQYCMKPWLMGQPVRKTLLHHDELVLMGGGGGAPSGSTAGTALNHRAVKRVHWKSPFFINCKFGVLQYVLLKFLCAVLVLILEYYDLYKEGDFSPRGGYLYICIITNTSQCWALYCLIFFYYATKTELAAIRPVGKFLSVKALVFFTWWQSVFISVLYQLDMIPHYHSEGWTPEDVAKAIQDYLICIEMFLAAVVHTIVFPHTEYSQQAVEARRRALNQLPMTSRKRLGRHATNAGGEAGGASSRHYLAYSAAVAARGPTWRRGGRRGGGGGDDHSSKCSTVDPLRELELATLDSSSARNGYLPHSEQAQLHHYLPYHRHQQPSLGASSVESHEELLLHPSESWEMAAEDQVMINSKPLLLTPPRSVSIHAENAVHHAAVSTIFEGDEQRQLIGRSSSGDFAVLQPSFSDGPQERYRDDDNDDDGGEACSVGGEHDGDGDLYEFDDDDDDDSCNDEEEDHDDHPARSRPSPPRSQHQQPQLRMSLVEGASAAASAAPVSSTPSQKPGFVSALIDSAIPLDLRDNTVGIVKGDYRVERKTLLHHATTSDNYDLFSHNRRGNFRRGGGTGGTINSGDNASGNNSVDTAESSHGKNPPQGATWHQSSP